MGRRRARRTVTSTRRSPTDQLPFGSITDVAGINVGPLSADGPRVADRHHRCDCRRWRDTRRRCSGGGPGTRETDAIDPQNLVQEIHGICLTGGSAFGLAASYGLMSWLEERSLGFPIGSGEGFHLVVPGRSRCGDLRLGKRRGTAPTDLMLTSGRRRPATHAAPRPSGVPSARAPEPRPAACRVASARRPRRCGFRGSPAARAPGPTSRSPLERWRWRIQTVRSSTRSAVCRGSPAGFDCGARRPTSDARLPRRWLAQLYRVLESARVSTRRLASSRHLRASTKLRRRRWHR